MPRGRDCGKGKGGIGKVEGWADVDAIAAISMRRRSDMHKIRLNGDPNVSYLWLRPFSNSVLESRNK